MLAKILVVDDEPDIKLLVNQRFKKHIHSQKYKFIFAGNANEALVKLIAEPDIDMVLSDINMPGMDGLTLLNKTNQINPLLKTVIISGYGDMGKIRKAMNEGAFDFLTKPIDFNDLEITINKTLTHVRQIKESMRLRREQEKILHQQALVFENIYDSVIITDLSGHIIDWNYSTERMFGYSKVEVLGKISDFLYKPDAASILTQEIFAKMRSGDRWIGELSFICKDGTEVVCETIFVPVYDNFLEKIAVIGVNHDITERKQAEAEIYKAIQTQKELNQLKSSFVSMVSHEFRTPLSTILTSTELLLCYEHKFSNEKKRELINKIPKAAHQISQLLNDLLLIGKAEIGKLKFQPEKLDLEAFCQEILEEIKLTDRENHIFSFSTQEKSLEVEMDKKLLRHILINLLSNAVKYSPKNTLIEFNLIQQNTEITFTIKDQGIGIPKADQDDLFELFHRGSNVGEIEGTGLGMAITKNAVDLHQGSIKFDSEVGVGTTFRVSLPCASINEPALGLKSKI